jgi:uncharacterized caspase-like protein
MKSILKTWLFVAVFALASSFSSGPSIAAEAERNLVVSPVAAPKVEATQARRFALVIGNSSYKDAPLANPVNDARAFAQVLRDGGFSVASVLNGDHKSMLEAIRVFGDRLKTSGGTGLFYFAGHGMQIKGKNYLIPVGSSIAREDEVVYASIDAQAILDKMESAGNGTNIMILDACRNNPFLRGSRTTQQGLAQMDAPVGTLVAFATSPGSVASDGAGDNGLYTRHLLRTMKEPGLKVEDVFKRVRAAVRKESEGRQVPWESTSLEGDFYFRPTLANFTPEPGRPGAQPLGTGPAESAQSALDVSMWELVSGSNQAVDYRAYLVRFPNGQFVKEATLRLGEMEAKKPTNQASNTAPQSAAQGSVSPPVYGTPNKYGYAVGDTRSYQLQDTMNKASPLGFFTHRISNVLPNGDLEINGNSDHILTAWGSDRAVPKTRTDGRTYTDTHMWFLPATMKIGQSENFKFNTTEDHPDGSKKLREWSGEIKVLSREKIRVPGGEFNAYKITRNTFMVGRTENRTGQWTCSQKWTFWYAQEARHWVAYETELICPGAPPRGRRVELTSYSISPEKIAGLRE